MLLCLCSAAMACNEDDPIRGEKRRPFGPRLTHAAWKECCRKTVPRESCKEAIEDREKGWELLEDAHGECLDRVIVALEKYAKDDLAAAYFVRAQRRKNPIDLLRALDATQSNDAPAPLFNRALAQEKLGLIAAAQNSWNTIAGSADDEWAKEARNRLARLTRPAPQWRADELEAALRRRDRAAVETIVRAFPADAAKYFEQSNLVDADGARLFADALASTGDFYASAIVEAAGPTKDRDAWERGVRTFQEARRHERNTEYDQAETEYAQAAGFLERSGNPLSLAARYGVATSRFITGGDVLPLLDSLVIDPRYRNLTSRFHTMRAAALDIEGRYTEALAEYSSVIDTNAGSPKDIAKALTRRCMNYLTTGRTEKAFFDAYYALKYARVATDMDTLHQANAGAAAAASKLGYPAIALQYQTAAVAALQRILRRVPASPLAKQHLSIALRARAQFHLALKRDVAAATDLEEASRLADSLNDPALRSLLQMHVAEVRGELLVTKNPAAAVAELTRALDLATGENSSYRAELHFKRAAARSLAGDSRADDDLASALDLIRSEATLLVGSTKRGQFEDLWRPYLQRFQSKYRELIENLIAAKDFEQAFLYAEDARAFEPMQLLLQSKPVPPGFRKIRTQGDLHDALAELPEDTVILQYLVLADKTYVWVLTRGRIVLYRLDRGAADIAAWVAEVHVEKRWEAPMQAVYDSLLRAPLRNVRQTRIVIVPDGAMHALPFAAAQDASTDQYLVQRGSIAIAGSTSLYLYARYRDQEFRAERAPGVLIVGDPAASPALLQQYGIYRSENARNEAQQLSEDYGHATLLTDDKATSSAFLEAAQKAAIIHFAGHGVANPENPWLSMLVLAPDGKDTGELTAEKLLTEVQDLDRTRLIVLAACSSASGESVGPEGVAPLVRPLIAARVPGVVGTLWNVADIATLKALFLSLHCHYRNGDDVAVALQKAQLEMLRENEPARTWAPIQVFGFAGSPYAHHAAMEERHRAHLCTEDSLHRPDGLHPQ